MTTSSVVITLVSAWILVDALILLFVHASDKHKGNDDYFDGE